MQSDKIEVWGRNYCNGLHQAYWGLLVWGWIQCPTQVGYLPLLFWGIAFLWLVVALIYWFRSKKRPQIEQTKGKQLKLNLGKFLLDGKEILLALEKMDAKLDSAGYVSTELKFEIWYKNVSKTLKNTDYDQLWFENKKGLDYRTANKSDYVEACKYGLDRLEYIKQLILDKGSSQN